MQPIISDRRADVDRNERNNAPDQRFTDASVVDRGKQDAKAENANDRKEQDAAEKPAVARLLDVIAHSIGDRFRPQIRREGTRVF